MAGADPQALKDTLLAAIGAADTPDALEAIRIEALGKKGELTLAMKSLGQLDGDARREMGQALNAVKDAVSEALDQRRSILAMAELNKRLEQEKVDVSLSHRPETQGVIHPLSRTLEEILAIFAEWVLWWPKALISKPIIIILPPLICPKIIRLGRNMTLFT